jgi:hypothetical protein
MKRLRTGAPAVPVLDHPDDVTTVNEINDAARSMELFKRAATLQEREVLRLKNLALAEIHESVRGERERLARKIAGAVLELAAAVSEEGLFVESLRSQDEAVIPLLRPQPFPMAIDATNSAIVRWLSVALGISEAEVQARMAKSSRTPLEKTATAIQ